MQVRLQSTENGSEIGLQDLRRLVALGEGLYLEFKRRLPDGLRIAKEMTALANTRGGHLLIGISDEGEILGVRDAEEEEFLLHQAIEQHCSEPIEHSIRRVPVSRRRFVIVVDIPECRNKPLYVVDPAGESKKTAYVRVADMSVEASREAVRIMKTARRETDVRFSFGDKELTLMRYLEEYGQITVEQFARVAAVPRRAASQTLVLLTRARVLSFHLDGRGDYFTLAARSVA